MAMRRSWIRIGAVFAVAAWIAGCETDPDEVARGDLCFKLLRYPARVVEGVAPGSVGVAYYVGPNGCWGVESIDIALEEGTIRISGTAVDESDGSSCTQALVYGRDTLALPPLTAGTYRVIAGSLIDTLVVVLTRQRGKAAVRLSGPTPDGGDFGGREIDQLLAPRPEGKPGTASLVLRSIEPVRLLEATVRGRAVESY